MQRRLSHTFPHPHDQAFFDEHLARLPLSLHNDILNSYIETAEAAAQAEPNVIAKTNTGRHAANTWLRETVLKNHPIIRKVEGGIQATRDDIIAGGEKLARECARMMNLSIITPGNTEQPIENNLEVMNECVQVIMLNYKTHIKGNIQSQVSRALDPAFWVKRIRKLIRQHREALHQQIAPTKINYASTDARNESRSQDLADKAFRSNFKAVSNDGVIVSLPTAEKAAECARAELFTRMRGLTDIAKEKGMTGSLVTLTLPSRFHPTVTYNKHFRKKNPKYDGSTPADGQADLTGKWAKTRAALAHAEIDYEWIRTAEPHTDETPHWHLVVYHYEHDADEIEQIIKHYFLDEDQPDEPGAQKNRVDFKRARGGVEGAMAYATKYATKHTTGLDNSRQAEHIRAWRRTWNIRAYTFSQDSVTVYRLARKRDMIIQTHDDTGEIMQLAARQGRYADFLKAQKSVGAKVHYVKAFNKYDEIIRKPAGIITFKIEDNKDDKPASIVSVRSIVWQLERFKTTASTVISKEPSSLAAQARKAQEKATNNDVITWMRHDASAANDDDDGDAPAVTASTH